MTSYQGIVPARWLALALVVLLTTLIPLVPTNSQPLGHQNQLRAEEPKKVEPVTFEGRITAIFKERCWKCHAGAEPKQNLRLTSRQELLKGGEGGPAGGQQL